MRPRLVQRVVGANGETIFEPLPEELGRPIRPETAKTTTYTIAAYLVLIWLIVMSLLSRIPVIFSADSR